MLLSRAPVQPKVLPKGRSVSKIGGAVRISIFRCPENCEQLTKQISITAEGLCVLDQTLMSQKDVGELNISSVPSSSL